LLQREAACCFQSIRASVNSRTFQFATRVARRKPADRLGRPLTRRLIPTLILLLTLAWQSLAIETHVHPLEAGSDAVVARAASHSGIAATAGLGSDPAICPFCQELAQAGHLLSSTLPAFDQPDVMPVRAIASSLIPWTRRDRSHAWLGRGPPSLS
jgi:hypothetical protein